MFSHDQPNFADRHIGPDADAVAVMLKTIGVDSLDELADKALPAGILDALSTDGVAPGLDHLPAGGHRRAGARGAACTRRRQHRRGVDDRPGLLRHADPARVAAQHPREPGLVHGLHAVSAGDQPGPTRGAAELPDHGCRPDRPRGGQRVDARRGHRRRRGDDADASRRARSGEPARRGRRPVPTDRRCDCDESRAAWHRDRHRRPARRPSRRRVLRGDRPTAGRRR